MSSNFSPGDGVCSATISPDDEYSIVKFDKSFFASSTVLPMTFGTS